MWHAWGHQKYGHNFSLKSEGKRLLGVSRYIREDTIKMDLEGGGCEFVDWIYLVQDKVLWLTFMNSMMNSPVP
jgi:hypothetical protein